MTTRNQIVIVSAGVIAVGYFRQYMIIRALRMRLAQGMNNFNKLYESANYLLGVIEENGIVLQEFDAIAINAIFGEEES